MNETQPDPRGARGALIDRLVRRARLAFVWEGVWPALAAAITVVALFLSLSWFGLWDALPPLGRMAGVALFALAGLAALAPLIRIAAPGRGDLLARIDRASGVAHRPATSLDDRLAPTTSDDPLTRALWQAHRDRVEAEARRLRAPAPAPRLAARDPYALRFLVGLVLVVAFSVAGGDRAARVSAAFDWTTPAAEATPARIDAWVAPPAYTARPPIYLTAGRPAAAVDPRAAAAPDAAQTAEAVRAPTGSILVVRAAGGSADIRATGGVEPVELPGKTPDGVVERRFKLTGEAEATVETAGAEPRVWRFAVIPDQLPTIALVSPPQRNARGTLTVSYDVKDDYGVAGAEARFALKPAPPPKPLFGQKASTEEPVAKRPLYDAPKVALGLPRARAREGQAQTPLDLMEHPWAGADVVMTLHARDEAGQEGASAATPLRLPARPFTNPLARALVEQRRDLALDANAKPKVAQALQALMLLPEEFTPQASIYLGLRTAYRRLELAHADDQLREVADYLWQMALRIEDGDLPEAEKNLRAAEEALRQALENGASEQEIAKLTEDLRKALDQFMKELAQKAQHQPNGQAQKSPNGAQAVTPQDLQKMIDRMEQMAKSGARDAARQALNELRQMLDNLQTAQRQQQDPNSQAQQQQLDKLQDMIRDQSKLRDKTFQQFRQNERADRNQRGQGRRQPGQQGQKGEQDQMGALAEQQQALRDKLDQLMKEMQEGQAGQQQRQGQRRSGQQQGQQPGQQGRQPGQQGQGQQPGQGQQGQQGQGEQGEGENALGEAGRSMGDARGSLGQGETGQALDDQGRALENLRKGAQNLANQMQEGQQGGQPGQQPGEGAQGMREGEDGRDDDPLGRPVRRRESDGTTTKVPGEIEAQRARRVLEELRRRLGENERSRDELDYLERLLTP
ncbi:TIGR02302 family protein [Methylopila sp. Yamaguchi]|uniref:TIGR02302 family protein n=1 Tax=Methylopila sp. Yamaguchi TaxID=1437817 RepID=UPI000CB5561A|nr:TIGR02302 family protein [Methylopila sp. Yamaguchi]GBD49154.1 hypothetical protein METY_2367 [Methylopila sp. Yamaguchi]